MRPVKVSVLVSKKLGKNYSSWSLSYGTNADLDAGEDYRMVIRRLSKELKEMLTLEMPVNEEQKEKAKVIAIVSR